MAILATVDNVQQSSSTKGLVSFQLGATEQGYQSFKAAYPAGGSIYYFAREITVTGLYGKNWEIGVGTLTAATGILTRTTVLFSSNAGSKVPFQGPLTRISSTIPQSVLSGIIALPNGSTATTQAPGDNSTLLSTDSFVQAAVAAEAVLRATGDTNAIATAEAASLPANYFTPKIWASGADLVLGIGQSIALGINNATSFQLHVACGDGQIYEMEMAGNYTAAAAAADSILQPNNVVPATNSFVLRGLYVAAITTNGLNVAEADGGFRLETGGSSVLQGKYTFFTSTVAKRALIKSGSTTSGASYFSDMTIGWQDTTTIWSSLGTIIMPNSWTGIVLIRRIL